MQKISMICSLLKDMPQQKTGSFSSKYGGRQATGTVAEILGEREVKAGYWFPFI
jgi:hypothetical protein